MNEFLAELQIENINQEIKNFAIQIRRSSNLKLPICIIAATSIGLGIPLISADKALKTVDSLDLIIYEK